MLFLKNKGIICEIITEKDFMLVEFSFGNFKSFKDRVTLSMIASNDKSLREENVFQDPKGTSLVKSVAIYGANASGKSNVIEAYQFFRWMILNSFKKEKGDEIEVTPFLLSGKSEKAPSFFQVIVADSNGTQYRYGFTTDKRSIKAEWFFYRPITKEVELFWREGNVFKPHKRLLKKMYSIQTQTGDAIGVENALAISIAARYEENLAIEFVELIKRTQGLRAHEPRDYAGATLSLLSTNKERFLKFLEVADIHITGVIEKEMREEDIPEDINPREKKKLLKEIKRNKVFDLKTTHRKYDVKGFPIKEHVEFSLLNDESEGTKKIFNLSGPLLDTLDKGYVILIDELAALLHPYLVRAIVRLFNSKEFNKKNAQLIFATHDTNLLSGELFRRDQIWLTERNRVGASSLFSLADFKKDDKNKVRKDANFEKQYLEGKFGGIPALGDLAKIVKRSASPSIK